MENPKYRKVEGDFKIRHLCQVETEADMESFRAYRRFVHARWYANNLASAREKAKGYAKRVYAALSPEAKAVYLAKQNARRRGKVDPKSKARHAAWREANREHSNAAGRAWVKANPEKAAAIRAAAQAARRAAGKANPKLVAFLKTQPCLDCGSTEKIELGHLIPVANGGTNHPLNLIAQCRSCNRRMWRKIHPKAMMVHYPLAALAA